MEEKPELIYSPYIKRNFIRRKSNQFFCKIINFLFRKVKFDNEGLTNLKQYSEKGKCVFTSFQGSQTSLLIFTNQLEKNGYKIPVLGFGFNPFEVQLIFNFFSNICAVISDIFKKKGQGSISDLESIKSILNDNSIVISLLSKKAFFRRYIEIKSDLIQYLVEIQKTSAAPIYIFPEIIFWNMNPERTKSIVSLNPTRNRGLFSGLFTVMKSVTPAFIRVSVPINLKEEIAKASTDDSKHISQLIRNKLLEKYNHEKRTTLGPVIKSKNEMIEKVLFHKNVLNAINELLQDGKITEKKLRQNAYKFYNEIAADFSIATVNFFEKIMNLVFRKIFDGIHYDTEHFKKIREASHKGPLVIVPCHKSHMDYLIISCLFYRNRIVPPHILAGSNLTFFPMGKIFRKSGAFFMRRSFKGKILYSAVFKQYVKTLINEGYNIEFFIEGGRTRSGKLVSPKMGMLKYLIDAIDEGYHKDLIFVPLSINYDRILEESSYDKELKGKGKKKETTSALVKSRKLLKRKYGRVYVEFNEPFSFNEFRKKHKNIKEITPLIGNHIIRKINEVIMVTPISLTTTSILFSHNLGFTIETLKEKMISICDYLKFIDAPLSEALKDETNYYEIIDHVIKSFLEDKIVIPGPGKKENPENDTERIFRVNPEYRGRINFYKNSILHFFIPVSFISISISNNANNGKINIKKIKNEFHSLMGLFSKEFVYSELLEDIDRAVNRLLKYLIKRSIVNKDGNSIEINKAKNDELRLYAEMVQDYYESYYIVLNTVINLGIKNISKKDLMTEIRKNGVSMYREGRIKLMESLSISNYNNAIKLLSDNEIIMEGHSDEKAKDYSINNTEKAKSMLEIIDDYMSKINNYNAADV